MLGVIVTLTKDRAELYPCPERIARIIECLQKYMDENLLLPEEAQRIVGKLTFLQTTSFGQMGTALLMPVYSRAHRLGSDDKVNDQLSDALRASLTAILASFRSHPPRTLPFQCSSPVAVLYTDAFFQLGKGTFGPADPDIPERWRIHKAAQLTNVWGLILKVQEQVFYASGSVPARVLKVFSKRRAFIYALEVIGQMIAFVLLRPLLTPFMCCYIDNMPGKTALTKGYGRDPCINNLLSFTWTLLARFHIMPHFEWVPSDQNIVDPISRFDNGVVEPHWTQVTTCLFEFWKFLLRIADDVHFATSDAVDLAMKLQLKSESQVADRALGWQVLGSNFDGQAFCPCVALI